MANPQPAPQPWGSSPVPQPAGGVPAPHVPAPTLDVQVRTMESDLASLRASGGNTVSPETIALHVQPVGAPHANGGRAFRKVLLAVISLVVLAGLLAAGYFLYRRLVHGAPVTTPASDGAALDVPAENVTPAAPSLPGTAVPITLAGAHQSFLVAPADTRVTLVLDNEPVSDPSQLRTYNQRLRDTLATVRTATAELTVQNTKGAAFSFPGFLAAVNAPIIDAGIFQANFEPDFTFLAVREGQIFNAAYVLKLREGKNWLFVKNDVAKLEAAPGLEALFPRVPGARSGSFTDTSYRELPTRTVSYTNPDAQFVYGWFRDYLILATSETALKTALDRLCFFSDSC